MEPKALIVRWGSFLPPPNARLLISAAVRQTGCDKTEGINTILDLRKARSWAPGIEQLVRQEAGRNNNSGRVSEQSTILPQLDRIAEKQRSVIPMEMHVERHACVPTDAPKQTTRGPVFRQHGHRTVRCKKRQHPPAIRPPDARETIHSGSCGETALTIRSDSVCDAGET